MPATSGAAPARRRLALVAALAIGAAACSAGPPGSAETVADRSAPTGSPAGGTGTGSPAPGLAAVAADPQAGIDGVLRQYRRDVPARRLQVRLTAGNAGLVVEAVEVLAPGVPTSPAAVRDAELRPGAPLELPVVAGPGDCDVTPAAPRAVVRLRDAAGTRREVTVPLADDGLVRRLHESDCAEQELRRQAAVEVAGVRPVTTAEGPALDVVVRLRRTGGDDDVRVVGIGSNTVYAITALGPLPTLGSAAAVDLDLRLVPARCDVHALGESYRTGLIGLVLAVGAGDPRPFVLTPDDAVRQRLEAFAVETCRAAAD
ncbi:hypothetical protein GCU56_07090 [Geodermatophilus sabuli]|uniref:Lipoprotein n=1 Tax=Geodermatophilus sabuli TaxID=1564158 RepID=A0A7K3W0E5_9ACTN|nr:hypothetical protein [Geodermatophilus sabuli]NEK57634.1 hypothetical protein [Geodermatophilus sabuli]